MKIISIFFVSAVFFTQSSFAQNTSQFKNESEAGLVVTGGNTYVSTLSFKDTAKLIDGWNSYSFNARYLRSANEGIEQAMQWGLGIRFERQTSARFSLFLGQLFEANIYQNILQRYATDLGSKYFFYQAANQTIWFMELGYRYARENYRGGARYNDFHFARLYSEVERFWNKTISGKFYVEYLPNFTFFKAYQVNTGVSFSAVINEVFSMKNAYDVKYNNEPPAGTRSNSDRIFTTSLVAKF